VCLPNGVPWELVPGFVTPAETRAGVQNGCVRFLYNGTLDQPRGLDVLLKALPLLPDTGWLLNVTGAGPLDSLCRESAQNPHWKGRVRFHGRVDDGTLFALRGESDVGLNCQRHSDPISGVTFPSKIFSYLSAGVAVISSRASEVPAICGKACRYYDGDNPKALAHVMIEAIEDFKRFRQEIQESDVTTRYSMESTAARLKPLLAKAGVS